MIRKLRIQIVFSISTVSTIFVILFLSSTYLSAKSNMKNSCYSDMSYILSDISAASESTYPIAVVTVNYSGTCTLLLDHLFTTNKEEILSLADNVSLLLILSPPLLFIMGFLIRNPISSDCNCKSFSA